MKNLRVRGYKKTENITKNIRKAFDDGNIVRGAFVDLEKAFDTVDHQILLAKLNHYGIHGVSDDWFKSYLSNRNQYVPINGYESGIAAVNCGVPLFSLYMNNLNQAIKFCKVHHFVDDINLLCLSNSIKKLNKLVNTDLKHLINWLFNLPFMTGVFSSLLKTAKVVPVFKKDSKLD